MQFTDIKHRFAVLFALFSLLLLSGCGFSLRGVTQVPDELKVMQFETSDPYGQIARMMDKQLRLNGIQVETDKTRTDIPILRVLNTAESKETASIFRDGKTAEYQMVFTINAQVIIPEKGIFPISATSQRTFFDNPLTALAKDAEQDIIKNEMREQATQVLIRRLLTITTPEKERAQTYSKVIDRQLQ